MSMVPTVLIFGNIDLKICAVVSRKYFPPVLPLWYFSFILSHFQFSFYKGQMVLMLSYEFTEMQCPLLFSEAKCIYAFRHQKVI